MFLPKILPSCGEGFVHNRGGGAPHAGLPGAPMPKPPLTALANGHADDSTRGVALMVGCSVLFAMMATFVGAAHKHDPTLSTLVTSAFRSGVNLIALIAMARGNRALLFGDGRAALWARGVFGGLSLVTYFTALAHLGVGEAAFLNQTSAVWVALLAPVFLGERTGRLVWVAVGCSLVGVALLATPHTGEGNDLLGRGMGLLSGLCAAGAYLTVRKAGASNRPITIVFYFTLVAAIGSVTGAVLAGDAIPRDPITLGLLIGAGLSATFAQLIMTEAYRVGRAGPVAAAGAAGPLFSTVLGAIWLGQVPDTRAVLGMTLLVLSGIGLPFLAARK